MIEIKLLGIPQVAIDGKKIVFPYDKVSGLIYYLAEKGEVTRDELADIFWEIESESVAKKNLRNAIYQANKNVGENLIFSSGRNLLVLNPDLAIKIDLIEFMENPKDNIDLYCGDFLENFFIKGSQRFEDWSESRRKDYNSRFEEILRCDLEDKLNGDFNGDLEGEIKKLISMDEWEENNHRLLLNYYKKTGNYSKAASHYYDLKEKLMNELSIEPSKDTTELFLSFFPSKEESVDLIYGREKERALLTKMFKSKRPCVMFITGEPGSGKSFLFKYFLKEFSKETDIISLRAYDAESFILKKGFYNLCEKLQVDITEDDLIKRVSRRLREKSAIIVIDDAEKLDEESMSIISSIAIFEKGVSFLFISGYTDNETFEKSKSMIMRERDAMEIDLQRFTKEDMRNFSKDIDIEDIMEKSSGNPFFFNLLISKEDYNKKLRNFIRNIFYPLNLEERSLLINLSLFDNGANIDILSELNGEKVGDILRKLSKKGLIYEDCDNNFKLFNPMFSHGINSELYEGERKKLREDILRVLKKNRIKKSDFKEELYQARKLEDIDAEKEALLLIAEREEKSGRLTEELLRECEKYSKEDYRFLTLRGRYFIQKGEPKKAINDLNRAIVIAISPKERVSLLISKISALLKIEGFKEAFALYDETMRIAEELNDHKKIIQLDILYGELLYKTGKKEGLELLYNLLYLSKINKSQETTSEIEDKIKELLG